MSDFGTPAQQGGVTWERLQALLAAAGPGWLERRRWYADKGRAIANITIAGLHLEVVNEDLLALTVVDVTFAGGEAARYLAPLALTPRLAGDEGLAVMGSMNGETVVDATEMPWFGQWLLGAFGEDGSTAARDWRFTADNGASAILERAARKPGTRMSAEQSNTSLKYGDALIVKLIRRLQPGPNPDEEILRALSAQGFSRVPPYAGAGAWRADDGVDYPIALAQAFVPNHGDGWSWTLNCLAGIATHGLDAPGDAFAAERLLGQRTAELHLALSEVDDPAFAPETADAGSISQDIGRTEAALDLAVTLLAERQQALPENVRQRLPEIIVGLRDAVSWTAGYQEEAGVLRIRVHGDYHLGQTLRTLDDDWVIIDFEGEPARPVSERRQRASALKDVSGMLRSYAYARGFAERALPSDAPRRARDRLAAWERGARAAFLAGYRAALPARATAEGALAPADSVAFARAVRAWELDKALYEIAYEARNRPGWLELPLRALLAAPED